MSDPIISRIARRLFNLERRHDALARSRQLPNSSLTLPSGDTVSIAQAAEQAADANRDLVTLDGHLAAADAIANSEAIGGSIVPEWIGAVGVSGDLGVDAAAVAYERARAADTKADLVADDLLETALDAAEALEKANLAIVATVDEYAVNTSSTSPPVSGWLAETPDWVDGEYVWRRTRSTLADGSISYGAPGVMTGSSGEDAVLVRVLSTRGTAFKNSTIATDLVVTVYKGGQEIKDLATLWATFGGGAYLEWWWRRLDDTAEGVISSADPRISQGGFKLTVSPADVDVQTVFKCILHT